MTFSREETLLKAQELDAAGHNPEQIATLMTKDGYTNSLGRTLQPYTIGYMLSKGAKEDSKRRVVREPPMPAAAADDEGEASKRRYAPKNPSEGKVLLAQQILQTKDLPLMRRCVMAIDLLIS